VHILIVPSEFYVPDFKPTAGIFQQDHARLFREKGHQVGVLSVKPRFTLFEFLRALVGKTNARTNVSRIELLTIFFRTVLLPKSRLMKEELIENVPVFRYCGSYGLIWYSNSLKMNNYWIKIMTEAYGQYSKKYGKPDIIHAHNALYAGSAVLSLVEKHAIAFMLTERSSEHVMRRMTEGAKQLAKETFAKTICLNAVSPFLGKQMEEIYDLKKNKFKWLPNMMDRQFEKIKIKNEGQNRKFTFLNVANLIPLKGQKELIHAFAKTFRGDENVQLRIAGRGVLLDELKELSISLKVSKQLTFCGFLNRSEVLKEMIQCDIFVFPSHYETFGVVLIEAAAVGKPLIASNCGGPNSIVNKANGMLVEPKNIDDLGNAMKYMKSNIQDYNSHIIKQDIVRRFGKEAFYRNVMKEYEVCIHDKHS